MVKSLSAQPRLNLKVALDRSSVCDAGAIVGIPTGRAPHRRFFQHMRVCVQPLRPAMFGATIRLLMEVEIPTLDEGGGDL